MCNTNENIVLDLDFNVTNDVNNWSTNSINPVQIDNGVLLFNQASITDEYIRDVGLITQDRNRVRISSNILVRKKDTNAPSKTSVLFQLLVGTNTVYEELLEFDNLTNGIDYKYFFDRNIKYTYPNDVSSKIKLTVTEGSENVVGLEDLKVNNYNYCPNSIRSYFIIKDLFADSFTALSGGIKLKEYKVSGEETLTPDFFADTITVGGNPKNQWYFAKADLDGSNRVSENTTPNTFNPFEDEFKLTFDPAFGFKGGKANGTLNNKDYGQGIINIGVDKPEVVNGSLVPEKGAFFIDIDLTKDLKIVFDVIINANNSNLYVNPTYVREYFIEWDSLRCQEKYYYKENGVTVDQTINGFLSGLTPVLSDANIVECDQTFSPKGQTGNFSYVIDFGTDVGQVGIDYNAYGAPDRFIVEWNGQTFDTGFVGSNYSDQQLINAGVSPSDINTANPTNGKGTLLFNKNAAFPTQATVTVLAPLSGTAWQVKGVCLGKTNTNELAELGNGICGVTPASWYNVYFNVPSLVNFIPNNGDIVYADPNYNTLFNGGNDTFRMRLSVNGTINIPDVSFDVDVNGVISNVTECTPAVPLSLTYGFQNKINIDNTDSNDIRTLSVEQFIEYNPLLSGSDDIDFTLDYELVGAYPDSQCSFYITENNGPRQLIARQTGVGTKLGNTIIKLEPNKVYGVVQEMIYERRTPATAVNRVFVDGKASQLDQSRVNIINGNFSYVVSNLGTILSAS